MVRRRLTHFLFEARETVAWKLDGPSFTRLLSSLHSFPVISFPREKTCPPLVSSLSFSLTRAKDVLLRSSICPREQRENTIFHGISDERASSVSDLSRTVRCFRLPHGTIATVISGVDAAASAKNHGANIQSEEERVQHRPDTGALEGRRYDLFLELSLDREGRGGRLQL